MRATLPVPDTSCLRSASSCIALIATVFVATQGAAQQPVTRDSAGIRIVENRARTSAPVLRMGANPVINVGGLENDAAVELFHNNGYMRAVQLSSGGIAVIDATRVQYFDSRGTRLRVSGTAGRGPLELLALTAICVTRGDTVVVADSRNNRIAVLDNRGTIIRTIPRGSGMGFNSCLGDGTFLLRPPRSAATAGQPEQMVLERLRLDGSVVNTIGPIAVPPFRIGPSVRLGYAAGRDRVYTATGMENQIRILSPTGALTGIVRTADALRPLTSEESARSTGEARDYARLTGSGVQAVPTHWPPYSEVHVGSDGWLWVEEFHVSQQEGQAWVAFDGNGVLAGRLVIPAAVSPAVPPEVLGFGKGTIVVRRYDADGASFVSVYPIVAR